ncbi:MAG: tetratricopeptide repeat protein [Gemmataceae bacterium]
MLTCPMCKKKLRGLEKECLNCRTDVSLLVHYVEDLRAGLARADALTRAGELGEAVWAYLAVLEVDPDNATARRQVGQVATAVRQFDQTAPGRRWRKKLQKQTRFRRWMANWNPEGEMTNGLLSSLFWFLLIFGALMIGYFIGARSPMPPSDNGPPETKLQKPGKLKKDDGANKAPANP